MVTLAELEQTVLADRGGVERPFARQTGPLETVSQCAQILYTSIVCHSQHFPNLMLHALTPSDSMRSNLSSIDRIDIVCTD